MSTPDAELSSLLRQLRSDAGMSGRALAPILGWSQPKVSRIESGKIAPTPMDAGRFALAVGAPRSERRRAIGLALALARQAEGFTPVRVALLRGGRRIQQRIRAREERATRVATFHPTLVPANLQTDAYRLAMIGSANRSDAETAEWLTDRRAREAHRASRPAVLIVTEGALCWGVAGPEVMIAQCEHIARLAVERPNWTIGVIPRNPPVHAHPEWPVNGFDLYDDDTVVIGTSAGNAYVTDADTVASHGRLLRRLRALAITGPAIVPVLARIADGYRLVSQ